MQSIGSVTSSNEFSITEQLGGSQTSKADFLALLVAQLKNQDPLEPMKNEDFLTQLATFSQLEEQQKTNAAINSLAQLQTAGLVLGSLSQGASLVGKQVTYIDPETLESRVGQVTNVAFEPTGIVLNIGGSSVPVGNVIGISVGTPGANAPAAANPPVAPPPSPNLEDDSSPQP